MRTPVKYTSARRFCIASNGSEGRGAELLNAVVIISLPCVPKIDGGTPVPAPFVAVDS